MNADSCGPRWFKSSYSETSGQCVEVAFLDGGAVGIRDSKCPGDPSLVFARAEWEAFTAGVVDGEFRRV